MPTKKPLTNEQYIEAHVNYYKNVNDAWTASFECADGYSYSAAAVPNQPARTAKKQVLEMVKDAVIQGNHPIQRGEKINQ